jgi:hypothetical protein
MEKMNELQICITLNGSELCRNFTVEELETLDHEKIAEQIADILDTLQKQDKHNF